MPYTAEISRNNPALIGFLIDQSGSMSDKMAGTNDPKSDICARYIDAFFNRLLTKNTSGENIMNRFEIFAIGYGGMDKDVTSALHGIDQNEMPITLQKLQQSSTLIPRKKIVKKKVPDGADGFIETTEEVEVSVPTWIEPKADGWTPMNEALTEAFHITSKWVDEHKSSYPPILINITDGMYNTEDPEPVSIDLRELETEDGKILLFNIHISDDSNNDPVSFPSRTNFSPPDDLAEKLFRMSSPLVDAMIEYGIKKDKPISQGAVGFAYNAEFSDFIDFLDIGTRPAG